MGCELFMSMVASVLVILISLLIKELRDIRLLMMPISNRAVMKSHEHQGCHQQQGCQHEGFAWAWLSTHQFFNGTTIGFHKVWHDKSFQRIGFHRSWHEKSVQPIGFQMIWHGKPFQSSGCS